MQRKDWFEILEEEGLSDDLEVMFPLLLNNTIDYEDYSKYDIEFVGEGFFKEIKSIIERDFPFLINELYKSKSYEARYLAAVALFVLGIEKQNTLNIVKKQISKEKNDEIRKVLYRIIINYEKTRKELKPHLIKQLVNLASKEMRVEAELEVAEELLKEFTLDTNFGLTYKISNIILKSEKQVLKTNLLDKLKSILPFTTNELSAKFIPIFLETYKNSDEETKNQIINNLKYIPKNDVLQFLLRELKNTKSIKLKKAILKCFESDKPIYSHLEERYLEQLVNQIEIEIKKAEQDLHSTLIHILQFLPSEKTIQILLDLMKNDPYEGMRGHAAKQLGKLGAKITIEEIFKALEDEPNFHNQWPMAQAIISLNKSDETIQRLINIMKIHRKKYGRSPISTVFTKNYIVIAYDEILNLFKNTNDIHNQTAFLNQLIKLDVERTIPLLLNLSLSKNKRLRTEAIAILGRANTKETILALKDILRRRKDGFHLAITYLGRCKATEAIPELIIVIKRNPNTHIKYRAYNALKEIGLEYVLPYIHNEGFEDIREFLSNVGLHDINFDSL